MIRQPNTLSRWLDSSASVLCASGNPAGTPVGGRLCELSDGEYEYLDRLHRHGLAQDGDLADSVRLVLERLGPYATRTLHRVLEWGAGVRLWPGGAPEDSMDGNALHWLAGSVAPAYVCRRYGDGAVQTCRDWVREYGDKAGELEAQWRLLRAWGAKDDERNRCGDTPLDILEASPLGGPLLAEHALARLTTGAGAARGRARA